MKSKKIISVMLVLTMLLATLAVVSGAAGTPTVKVGTAQACPGEKVSVPVILSDNPGIAAYTLSINYDTTRLALDSVKSAEGMGGMFEFGTKAVWAADENKTFNGTFLTLEFTVLSDAPTGSAAVTVAYTSGDVCNFNEENIDFAIIPGAVTVAASEAQIKVADANVTAGGNVDVPVIISANPGIAAVTLGVCYDEDVLTLTGADSKVGGMIEVGTKLAWAAESDVKTNGEFFVLHFTAKDTAAPGETTVSLSYNDGDICNFSEENVTFAVVPGTVTVNADGPQIVVGDVTCYIGGKVDVPVSIVKNPGVAAMTLGIEYDESVLTLTGADSKVGGMIEVGTKLVWAAESDVETSGVFFILHFESKSSAGSVNTPVTVSYSEGDICNFNEENVDFAIFAGTVDISSVLLGDLDFDGKLTAKDYNIMKSMFLSLIGGTDKMKAAADLNGDGKITLVDVNLHKVLLTGAK